MSDYRQIRPLSRLGRLVQALLLCLCLLPAVALADGRLEPAGEPVPVEESGSESAGPGPEAGEDQWPGALHEAFGSGHHTSVEKWALLIPILAVVFIFGGPVVVIVVIAVLYYRAKSRREQQRAEITLKALETGRELPPELTGAKSEDPVESNLHKGLKNMGLGLGIVIGVQWLAGYEIGGLGFVLAGVGGAQLLLWKLDKPHSQDAD